jgi:hypothetical protein
LIEKKSVSSAKIPEPMHADTGPQRAHLEPWQRLLQYRTTPIGVRSPDFHASIHLRNSYFAAASISQHYFA